MDRNEQIEKLRNIVLKAEEERLSGCECYSLDEARAMLSSRVELEKGE